MIFLWKWLKKLILKKVPYGHISNGQTNFRKNPIQIFSERGNFKGKFKDSNQPLLRGPLLELIFQMFMDIIF